MGGGSVNCQWKCLEFAQRRWTAPLWITKHLHRLVKKIPSHNSEHWWIFNQRYYALTIGGATILHQSYYTFSQNNSVLSFTCQISKLAIEVKYILILECSFTENFTVPQIYNIVSASSWTYEMCTFHCIVCSV